MRHTLRFWGQMIEPAGLHPFLPSTMLVLAIFHSSFIAEEASVLNRKASKYTLRIARLALSPRELVKNSLKMTPNRVARLNGRHLTGSCSIRARL
jgi:hypothetical protein